MIPMPYGNAETRIQPKRLPGSPEGLETLNRFGVVPPPYTPAVLTADGSCVDRREVLTDPGLDVWEGGVGGTSVGFTRASRRRRPRCGLERLDDGLKSTQASFQLGDRWGGRVYVARLSYRCSFLSCAASGR